MSSVSAEEGFVSGQVSLSEEEDSACVEDRTSSPGSVYSSYMGHSNIRRWKPQALPESLNIDGKHVWEPPIFDYSHLIGEEYEKKREAVLIHTKGDLARATAILDVDDERNMLYMYSDWLWVNVTDARHSGDSKRASFFTGLWNEIIHDSGEVGTEFGKLDYWRRRKDDGTHEFMSYKKWVENGYLFDEDAQPTSAFPSEDSDFNDDSSLGASIPATPSFPVLHGASTQTRPGDVSPTASLQPQAYLRPSGALALRLVSLRHTRQSDDTAQAPYDADDDLD